jgi:chromate reductase, NAD(P)H dehydrogenase (quinone)
MKILVFAGSTRKDSLNRKLARAAAATLERKGLDVTLADLRDYPMPMYDGDLEAAGMPDPARAFRELLRAHDVFVIASPEYNGSFSGLLKNAIDWASRANPGERPGAVFHGKRAALLSASPGPGGGRRGLKHTRELLEMLRVEVLPVSVSIASAGEAFDARGALVRPGDAAQLDQLAGALQQAAAIAA